MLHFPTNRHAPRGRPTAALTSITRLVAGSLVAPLVAVHARPAHAYPNMIRLGVLGAMELAADGARRRALEYARRRKHVPLVAERRGTSDTQLQASIQLAIGVRRHRFQDVLDPAAGQSSVRK